ncbi:MAG TPA: hypothetical protein VHP37_02855 [Burkholderiales bacterium]|jgi:hypothetical protein|nr:hypothetical protein [Burkholderiales bacterium]
MNPKRFRFASILATASLGLAVTAGVSADSPPTAAQVAFAEEVSGLLINELVAALFQEFNETTAANVEHGKQAISIIFDDDNRNIRLIGTFEPQGGKNNLPSDSFEKAALAAALTGVAQTTVEKVQGKYVFRQTVPLSNTFHTACVLCHANFTPAFFAANSNPGQWVGALMVRVPIPNKP